MLPPRRGSHVGAVDERLGSLADLVDPIFGEEVDRALAFEESVLGMEPLAHAPGGERVREQEREVAKLSKPVVPVGTDVARPPASYRSVRDVGDGCDVDLGDAERLEGLDDLTCLDRSIQGGSHAASSDTSGSASSTVPLITGPDNHAAQTKPTASCHISTTGNPPQYDRIRSIQVHRTVPVPCPIGGDLDRGARPGPGRRSRLCPGDIRLRNLARSGLLIGFVVVISIARLAASADTAHYYLEAIANDRDDYYVASDEGPGRWLESGSALLGLDGEVTPEDIRAVLGGLDPRSGEAVIGYGKRLPENAGFGLCFSAPKSVSLLWGLGDRATADHVVVAHDDAVLAAAA